jgi:hypothetical protein
MSKTNSIIFISLAILGTLIAGCNHQASLPAAPISAPQTTVPVPAVPLASRQQKQAFIARIRQARMQRAQAMPQKQ